MSGFNNRYRRYAVTRAHDQEIEKLLTDSSLPAINQWWHGMRFVLNTMLSRRPLPWRRVSKRELQHIYDELLTHCALVSDRKQFEQDKLGLDTIWPKMRALIRKNPGLAKFMREYGVHSRFFLQFLYHVPQASSLGAAFGEGHDMSGKYTQIPQSDLMYRFSVQDEMFVWLRQRTRLVQAQMQTAKSVLFIGAGSLPELRRYDYPLGKLKQRIVGYDSNLQLRDHLAEVFAKSLEEYGIEYHFESFETAFADKANWGQYDLVVANGVLSYYTRHKQLIAMLKNMKLMLSRSENSLMMFDLQLMRMELIRDAVVLNWRTKPQIKPEKSLQAAMRKVRRACAKEGLEVVKCEFNNIGVMFYIKEM